MNVPEVQLIDLTKMYREVAAVNNLSLDVYQGEFLSLLGPSGCGKTTTLRMIAGLIEETSGTVLISGSNVRNVPVYQRNIGMVFQDYALFPHMTVRDNVAFGLRMRNVSKNERYERAEEMLALVQLPNIGDRYPSQLSGGQQQRVALARALAPRPTVLLLDEPLSNLDLKLRQEMRVELKRIQREVGITTIFVTHDQGEALSLSDRVAVMNNGEIIQIADPVELYEKPLTKYVASFLGDGNFFRGIVKDGKLVDDGVEVYTQDLIPLEGKLATVIIRSERMAIATEPVVGSNTATGVLETSIYLGSITRYYVRFSNGKQIMMDVVQSGHSPYPEGAHVTIKWEPDDCVVIKEK